MDLIKIIFIIIAVIYSILLIVFSILTKKPFKSLLYNALIGLFLFIFIDLTAFFTGVWIPINDYTVAISILGGLPGVLLLAVARFLLFCV
ncbi:MAG: pro-sigmaK processing inhibitor BofA family protein [Clostridia bacterium]|nr:pro-sigmaK processing inhibitor BofA family protein [Clostridia bacterium]